MESIFNLCSEYKLSGDQIGAVEFLVDGLNHNIHNQVLRGITGSGKTFTMANIIARIGRPSLIMAHNKTLAAQIYSQMKELFPHNAVEYFVSYYDYYQPEAYIPTTDTYIEKDAVINDQIDLLRHSATRSLLERQDVIVVCSVSCIYGLGSPDLYQQMTIKLELDKVYNRDTFVMNLVSLQYSRNDLNFVRGTFRIRGDQIDIFPANYSDRAWRVVFDDNDKLIEIWEFDPLLNSKKSALSAAVLYATSHHITPRDVLERAIVSITKELDERLELLLSQNKLVEHQRLKQKVEYDIEMMLSTGTCKGIENYSRYFTNRDAGSPPPTLFEYIPKDAILFVDESHVNVPQIRAMYNGDRARKQILVDYGFRLPSAFDNRPLTFEEWQRDRPRTIFVSATPSQFEIEESRGRVKEQIIRPTGLLDPECVIKAASNQVQDLLTEIDRVIQMGCRALVTTLTKKMSEELTNYLQEKGYKVQYLHSEVQTLERINVINQLRSGEIDIIVGINLLREGLDIPECALVAILDADKEGFLRSEVSLIQTIGRAARNSNGRAVLYADTITKSIQKAVDETRRRRTLQKEYNALHNIVPLTISSSIKDMAIFNKQDGTIKKSDETSRVFKSQKDAERTIKALEKQMRDHAKNLDFEKAACLRDQITQIKHTLMI